MSGDGTAPKHSLPRNQRLDASVYATAGRSTFFTLRASRALAPFAHDHYAQTALQCLMHQRAKSCCQVDVYCIMPDHIHLIITPIKDGASSLRYVERFKGRCGYVLRKEGWKGALWQPRSYDRVLRAEESIERIGLYILNNPVRALLADRWEAYRWCGIPQSITAENCL
jgi:putative transposase